MQENITVTHLAMARARLKVTQKDLAAKSRLSQTMVSELEGGRKCLESLAPHEYQNLLRALELDRIRIQIIEIG